MEGEIRDEMTAALCLMSEGEKGRHLFSFLSSRGEEAVERIANSYLKTPLTPQFLKERILNRTRVQSRLALEETHSEWILELLRDESPRVRGLLLEFLSAQKAEAILANLGAHERRQIQKPSRKVSDAVLSIVRNGIEKKLGLVSPLRGESFPFLKVFHLTGDGLRALLRDAGIEEICDAFSAVEPQVLRVFLSRCALSDSSEIRKRIAERGRISSERRREAQRRLLHYHGGQVIPERLFVEVGIDCFASALGVEGIRQAESSCRKLTIAEGYRFKRILRDRLAEGKTRDQEMQNRILRRLKFLVRKGKVRRFWSDDQEMESTLIAREAVA
jgi:hypothetical protein